MNRIRLLLIISICVCIQQLQAQTFYVDPIKGNDASPGTIDGPLATLEKAVSMANGYTGKDAVTIRIAPGLYIVNNPLKIRREAGQGEAAYTLEALVMPDDTTWTPAKMPVIQCTADSNRVGSLPHASSVLQVECSHVTVRGLKFTGNPNPASQYYYVIERRDSTLAGLEVSQCYFIGDKNTAPIQGGLFTQGAGISVDHCVFYGAKNAVMTFQGIKGFSLTHSIIYGAYEGAVWYGYGPSSNNPFIFKDNIIANGNYVWVGYTGKHTNYAFSHSLFTGNTHYLALNLMEIIPDLENKPVERDIRKTGQVKLVEVTADGVPRDYLNLAPGSAGIDIDAGIFKRRQP